MAISLLGPPRVTRDDAPIVVDTRKAIALVAYLATTGRPHRRDTLAALLWPDGGQDAARGALRRTLSTLGRAIGGGWLMAEREQIGLNRRDGLGFDVEQFRRLVGASADHRHDASDACRRCAAGLADAAGLYRDDFMAGFSLRDSPAFDDRQFFEAESLRRDLAGALEKLADCLGGLGKIDLAIDSVRRRLAMDPLHEPAHRALMLLYARNSQRTAAVRQYRECVKILDRELGVAPVEETVRLFEAISTGRLPGPAPGAAGETPNPVPAVQPPGGAVSGGGRTAAARLPFVGRRGEWELLESAYRSVGPDGRVVAIEGEAGIGKTRLADEWCSLARRRGARVVSARCFDGEQSLPYAPFVAALRDGVKPAGIRSSQTDLPDRWVLEAGRLAPELLDVRTEAAAPSLDDPGARIRFFEGVSQVLLAATVGAMPGILFFDDVHWADAASLDLLAYLVRRLRGQRALVLATWRTQDVPSDHRLRLLLTEARRDGRATEILLGRLPPAAVAELIGALGPDPAPGPLAEQLYRETEGLPFFIAEYLRALARGELAAIGGAWTLPGGARALLQTRLAGIGEIGRQILAAAATIGRSFDFDTLRAASGRGEEETLAALDDLAARGIVVEARAADPVGTTDEATAAYYFSHETLRALVLAETGPARRQILHHRVADALRARRGSAELASQIALHYRLAGRRPEAAEFSARAGERARVLHANTEALNHFRAALDLGDFDPAEAARLREMIGDLEMLAGTYGPAEASYRAAAADRTGPARAILETKLGDLYRRRGEWERAEGCFRTALPLADGDAGRAGVLAEWSLAATMRGDLDRAANLAADALAEATATDAFERFAQVSNVLGIIASRRGDTDAARKHLEQSLAVAPRGSDPSARVAALNNLAIACRVGGDHQRAIQLGDEALALCIEIGDRHREAALRNNLADALHAAGEREAALAQLKLAMAIFAEIGGAAASASPEIWRLTEW